jgi:hypothetical protein
MLATVKACDDDVWFSPLFHPYPAIHTWQNEMFTVSADLQSILFWQANVCSHAYSSRQVNISLCQDRVRAEDFMCQTEKRLNAL